MSELATRVLSAAILIPAALVIVWAGGWVFAVAAVAVAVLILVEWRTLTRTVMHPIEIGAAAAGFAAVAALMVTGRTDIAFLALAVLIAASGAFGRGDATWRLTGAAYAGLPMYALILLRQDASLGTATIFWLFAVVWATDIAAYVAGRAIGGAKIWPRISPNKTWAGLIGGMIAAAVAGAIGAWFIDGASASALAFLGAVFAIVSQAGDFLELAVKRAFGAKDSGALIPGHGGVMDRLDGLIAAAIVAAIGGVVAAGPGRAATGLLIW